MITELINIVRSAKQNYPVWIKDFVMYLFAHIEIIIIGISACIYVNKTAPRQIKNYIIFQCVLQFLMDTYLLCANYYYR